MSTANPGYVSVATEALHMGTLAMAALGLTAGLFAQRPAWVEVSLSLILLMPPLRLATTIIGEAHARRYAIAAMGVLLLAFLLLSRRLS